MPFGGDNMLDAGIIADMNGDGIVERADMVNCFVLGRRPCDGTWRSARRPSILGLCSECSTIGDRRTIGTINSPTVTVTEEIEIEFGPVIAPDVVKPKVVFAWDKAKGGYIATRGSDNPHRARAALDRLQRPQDTVATTGAIQETRSWRFPSTRKPKARAEPDGRIGGDRQGGDTPEDENPSPPPAKPYRRASLKGLTNPQIVAYMGDGKMSWDYDRERVVPTRLPQDFWTLPAKQAAAALVEINRTEKHRRKYRLAIDDRDGRQPPDACSIHYSHRSHRCLFHL